MKNSKYYAGKIKRIVAKRPGSAPAEPADRIGLLVKGVLEEDATPRQAASAMAALKEEFVDFNELRVSPVKDIAEAFSRNFPHACAKAESVTGALNAIFAYANALSLDFLANRTKREIRETLREKMGLSPYAESVVTLYGFDGHAMPVDNLLLEALKLGGSIHPDSDLRDLQGFLERITLAKDAIGCHEALRNHAAKAAPQIARKRARLERQAEAEAKARAEAEAKARAEAEAKEKAKDKAKTRVKARTKAKPTAAGRAKPYKKTAAAKSAKTRTGKTTAKRKAASSRAKK